MGQANQMLIRQRNEFRLRQGEGPQTDRRTDAERVPVFGAAVQRRRLRKLFLKARVKVCCESKRYCRAISKIGRPVRRSATAALDSLLARM